MTVFIVLEEVDLGYSIERVFYSQLDANKLADEKNKEYYQKYSMSGKSVWFHVEKHEVE